MFSCIPLLKKSNLSEIKNITQLRRRKRILEKKIRIREKLLKRKVKIFQDTLSPNYVYNEFLKTIKMDDSLLNLAPQALKLKAPIEQLFRKRGDTKQMLVALFGSLSAGILSFFALKRKKKTSVPRKDKESGSQLFI